jgi:CDP-glycerol glycerophosphotransferase (TagB/SpsB family)
MDGKAGSAKGIFSLKVLPPVTLILSEVWGRLLALVLLPLFRLIYWRVPVSQVIWLIGENRGDCLEDNGHAFYRYCRSFHPNAPVYFLVKRRSPFYRREFMLDEHAIVYGSVRHMLFFSRARVVFYTHTYRDLMYRRFFKLFGGSKNMVYLHHGTLGFKKFDAFYQANRNIMDVFTVGSTFERDIVVNQACVDTERVHITGYPRSDFLISNECAKKKQLLYIPTHRMHLSGKKKSEFIEQVDRLLEDSALLGLLEANDIVLKVYLHAYMQKTFSLKPVINQRIQVVAQGEVSVGDLLCSSMLMITDYSSVCWDFLSLGRPVVFYRFDLDNYGSERDSYIDLRDESFGEIAYDEDHLVRLIAKYLAIDCKAREDVLSAFGGIEARGDYSNCREIYDLLSKMFGYPKW